MIHSFSTMAGIGGIIPSAQCLCGPKGPDENVSACIPALQGGIPFFVIGAEVCTARSPSSGAEARDERAKISKFQKRKIDDRTRSC